MLSLTRRLSSSGGARGPARRCRFDQRHQACDLARGAPVVRPRSAGALAAAAGAVRCRARCRAGCGEHPMARDLVVGLTLYRDQQTTLMERYLEVYGEFGYRGTVVVLSEGQEQLRQALQNNEVAFVISVTGQ